MHRGRNSKFTINFFYLVNEKQAITKQELNRTLPNESYKEYIEKYIEKRVRDIYAINYNNCWFMDRYLTTKEVNKNLEKEFNKFQMFIKVKGCNYSYLDNYINENNKILRLEIKQSSMTINKFKELTKNIICLEKSMYQNERDKMYSRSAIVIVDETHFEGTYQLLNEISKENFEIFNTTEIPIKKSLINLTINDIPILERYLNYFNMKYKTQYSSDEDKLVYTVLLLRMVFNFCIFCSKEYDSFYHMFLECGMYHEGGEYNDKHCRELFDRTNELFFTQFDISRYFNWESEIEKLIKKNNKKRQCLICEEVFERKEELIKHLSDIHIEEVARVSKYCEDYLLFTDNFDSFMIQEVLRARNGIPGFVNDDMTKGVKYDLPAIFSGEL